MSLNNIYVRWFEPADLLDGGAAAKAWDKVAFDRAQQDDAHGRGELARQRAHDHDLRRWRCGGRPSWLRACRLSTGPLDPRTHWEQLYLPALHADRRRAPARRCAARLRSTTSFEAGTNITWTLTVADATGREVLRQSLDLEKGYLP